MAQWRVKYLVEVFGFLCRKKPITLTFFFLNLFNELAFAYRVAKLKLFASISATDAKPRNVIQNCAFLLCISLLISSQIKFNFSQFSNFRFVIFQTLWMKIKLKFSKSTFHLFIKLQENLFQVLHFFNYSFVVFSWISLFKTSNVSIFLNVFIHNFSNYFNWIFSNHKVSFFSNESIFFSNFKTHSKTPILRFFGHFATMYNIVFTKKRAESKLSAQLFLPAKLLLWKLLLNLVS